MSSGVLVENLLPVLLKAWARGFLWETPLPLQANLAVPPSSSHYIRCQCLHQTAVLTLPVTCCIVIPALSYLETVSSLNSGTMAFCHRVLKFSTGSGTSGLSWWLRWSSLPATWETWVLSLDWEDPLEKGMVTHSSILAWRIPWTEEPVGLQSMGL